MNRVMLVALVLLAAPAFTHANAQQYPVRPVRILIPFPAGGASDTIGRTVGDALSVQLGQPVVIDNRPGAAGRLATEILAKSEPDGYTLLVGGVGPLSISPALYKSLPYDERSFTPISRAGEILNVMVVNASSSARDVKQFIEIAKKRPGELRYGSSGPGQLDHLAGVFFERLAGVSMSHVPYKGGGPALIDLIAGDLQVMFSTYVVAAPHVTSGKLRALAVTTSTRQPLLANLPPVAETLPGYGVSNWNGIFAPARTPQAVADRLFVEVNKALKAPEVKKRQNNTGIEPEGSPTRADFVRFLREDRSRWEKIIREAGIKVE